MQVYDLVIVGGGASGILCAIEASKNGIENILLVEKDPVLGGALNLGNYNISKNDIVGKDYKVKLLEKFNKCNIDLKLNTMVLKIEEDNEVLCTSSENGIEKIKAKNIIITNGAKEGTRKALKMVGDRCSGIFNVSMAKKIFSMPNIIPGKDILIVGTETLYMIEKDLKESNVNIAGIITNDKEINTYGLTENIYIGYSIEAIYGEGRVNTVKLSNGNQELFVDCDTLIFANSLIPDGLVAMRSNIKINPSTTGPEIDNDFMTSRENIYACGNGVFIHKYIEDIEDECKTVIKNIINKKL